MSRSRLTDPDAPLGMDQGPAVHDARRRLRRLLRSDPIRASRIGYPRAADDGWLDRARRAEETGDHHAAAYAAHEACHRDRTAAEPWSVRARAHAALGRFDEAVMEQWHAAQLEPENAVHRLALGWLFEELGNIHAALDAFQQAQRLDPRADEPRLGIASVLLRHGAVDEAVELLRSLYARGGQRRIGDHLALALIDLAERMPAVQNGETRYITSGREIARMRDLLCRADQASDRHEIRTIAAGVRGYLDRCAHREFHPRRVLRWRAGTVQAAFMLLILSGGSTVVAVGQPAPAVAVTATVSLLAAVGLVARLVWVPRWLLNRWACAPPPRPAPSIDYRPAYVIRRQRLVARRNRVR